MRGMDWALLVAGVLLTACHGKERETQIGALSPGNATAQGGSGISGASARPNSIQPGQLGAICKTVDECSSGFCVDGVCCGTSCDTVCSRCDAPGSEGDCTVSSNDAACGLSCPEATECRSYGSGALSANCEAIGLCRTLNDCTSTDALAGTACAQGTGICDGHGECLVAGKSHLGGACESDGDCGQGHCVVGAGGAAICCDTACGGLCQGCGTDGHCNQTPRDDARCSPVDCPDDNLCRDYVPDITVNLCRGFGQCRSEVDCTFQELHSAAECNCSADGCKLGVGATCAQTSDCASGACEATSAGAKVCCAQGCAAQGLTCSEDGSGCVQCGDDGASCQSATASQVCANHQLTTKDCGNGCDATTEACSDLRSTGSVCDTGAQCTSTVCELDVTGTNRCCSSDCTAAARACGTDGSCVCPADRQDVNGSCLLNSGAECSTASDCASGSCVGTVAGGKVCCAQACDGVFCAADGSACVQCEGTTSICQGNIAQRCDDTTLVQTQCGNGCNTAIGVCNGLVATGQPCTASAQCGSTQCAADTAGTMRCCTPNCAATGRVCGNDGSCVCANPNAVFVNGQCRAVEGQACRTDPDCRSNACENTQAGNPICCSGACNGQICRANGQGCVACDGGPPTCQGTASRSCVNNAFVTTNCANGCNASTGVCNNLVGRGGNCQQTSQCSGSGSACQNGRCCEFDCAAAGRTCGADGSCACPSGSTQVGNICLLSLNQACEADGDCASGHCNTFFLDSDGDLHGDPNTSIKVCVQLGAPAPARYVVSNDDCCDSDVTAHPGQTQFQSVPDACGSFDYDCDGQPTMAGVSGFNPSAASCTVSASGTSCIGGAITQITQGCPGSFSGFGCSLMVLPTSTSCFPVGVGGQLGCR